MLFFIWDRVLLDRDRERERDRGEEKSVVLERRDLNRGRSAAALPIVMPRPGSTDVIMASLAVASEGGISCGANQCVRMRYDIETYGRNLRWWLIGGYRGLGLWLLCPHCEVLEWNEFWRAEAYIAPKLINPATENFMNRFIWRFQTYAWST